MYINLVLYEAMPTFLKYPSKVCSNRVTTAAEFMAYDHYPWYRHTFQPKVKKRLTTAGSFLWENTLDFNYTCRINAFLTTFQFGTKSFTQAKNKLSCKCSGN